MSDSPASASTAGPARRARATSALTEGWLRIGAGVAVYFAILAYPPLRVGHLLWPDWSPGTPALLAILAGPAMGWLVHQRWRNPLTRTVLRVTYTWVGLAFLAFALLCLWDVVALLGGARAAALPALPLSVLAGAASYALLNAHRIVVRRERVSAPGVSRPVRLVQLSDVHVGSRTAAYLSRVVRRTNRLAPDYVVITGDLLDLQALPERSYAPLAALEAPAFFAIGNHERYIDADAVCARVQAAGVTVLRNGTAAAGELQLIGIDDAPDRDQVERVLATLELDESRYRVLLYHRPDGLEAAARRGIGLMLCGHTHNGQIVPFNFLVRRVFARICGRYEWEGTVLYVSPGTGTWGPLMRLGSSNEITEITLCPPEPG